MRLYGRVGPVGVSGNPMGCVWAFLVLAILGVVIALVELVVMIVGGLVGLALTVLIAALIGDYVQRSRVRALVVQVLLSGGVLAMLLWGDHHQWWCWTVVGVLVVWMVPPLLRLCRGGKKPQGPPAPPPAEGTGVWRGFKGSLLDD